MWGQIKSLIHESQSCVVTTHLNPDGDGVGSAVALIELLLTLGKKVRFISGSPIPAKFQFLDFHRLHSTYVPEDNFLPFDLLFVLDTYKLERIGDVAQLLHQPKVKVICIDHHPTDHTFTPFSAIEPEACSAGALVYRLFEEYQIELSLHAAMGIYTSVISDTGRFSYGSTSPKAHQLAEKCIRVGVDPSKMHTHLFQQVPLDLIYIFSKALQKMEFYWDNKLVLQQIRKKDYQKMTGIDLSLIQDFDYLHEFNKSIRGVECAAILWELPDDTVRISLRSSGLLDIVAPMRVMGGGGHPHAAGALFKGTFEEAKIQLLRLLDQQI